MGGDDIGDVLVGVVPAGRLRLEDDSVVDGVVVVLVSFGVEC